jgi:hypothetical protein
MHPDAASLGRWRQRNSVSPPDDKICRFLLAVAIAQVATFFGRQFHLSFFSSGMAQNQRDIGRVVGGTTPELGQKLVENSDPTRLGTL